VEGVPTQGRPSQIVTESQNISASGVYCNSPHYLAPLSKVALTIVLPGQSGTQGSERLLKCEGVVVRCQGPLGAARARHYELACSFIALDARYRRLIDDFVTWRNLKSLRDAATVPARSAARNSRGAAARSATTRTSGRRTAVRAPARAAARRTTVRSRSRRTVH
jgi:hypothetical protein